MYLSKYLWELFLVPYCLPVQYIFIATIEKLDFQFLNNSSNKYWKNIQYDFWNKWSKITT